MSHDRHPHSPAARRSSPSERGPAGDHQSDRLGETDRGVGPRQDAPHWEDGESGVHRD